MKREYRSGSDQVFKRSLLLNEKEKRNKKKRNAGLICSVLAVAVAFGTIAQMIRPAVAVTKKDTILDCDFEVHKHEDECYKILYDEEGNEIGKELICGKADYVIHQHTDECYKTVYHKDEQQEERVLVCNLPEIEKHEHDDSCYETTEELICGKEEHIHDDSCYQTGYELICAEEHEHNDACYQAVAELVCGLEEHVHDDSCYEEHKHLICDKLELHTHDDSCYDENNQLICGKTELKEHEHTATCLTTVETDANGNVVNTSYPVQTFEEQTGEIKVAVTAPEGAFPAGTTMKVTPVIDENVLNSAAEKAAEGSSAEVTKVQAVDITFTDSTNNEIEPLIPIQVVMTPIETLPAQEETAVVCHVDNQGEASVIELNDSVSDADISDESVVFETDSFSVYALVYTVDFEYSVNGQMYQFSLPGGEEIALSDLIEVLGIIGDTNNGEKAAFNSVEDFLKEVANVQFSDESLVKVTKNEEADDWTLESLEPFTSEETLAITMKNGDVVTVKVTDDQESSSLSDFLTKVTVSGASLENGNYVVEQGKEYSVTMTFKETANLQFDNEATLTYHMPSGVTLPDSIEKDIMIAIVSGGKTYEVKAHVLAGTDGTVTVKFDESDPNYSKLASATNVSLRVSVNAQFNETINKTQWGAKMDKDIILDTTDHSDVFAEKSGSFDESTGIFHYTVKVKANGDVTNVNVKDIISGNALIFNNDVQVAGNSSGYTNNGLSAGQKGFDYTFASMADGEEIIITYSASLDQTVAKNSDTITADQTKNTVTVQKKDGEPHNAVYSQEINMKSPQKSDGTIAGVTADGDKLYNWTIDYNPLALVSAAGDKIKDSIGASSQEYMKYYGNVTVKVYDHAGTLVDTRSFTPGSDSSWEYTIPTGIQPLITMYLSIRQLLMRLK